MVIPSYPMDGVTAVHLLYSSLVCTVGVLCFDRLIIRMVLHPSMCRRCHLV